MSRKRKEKSLSTNEFSANRIIDLESKARQKCFDIIYRVATSEPDPMPTNEKPWSDAVEEALKSGSGDRWPDVRELMAESRRIEFAPEDVPLEKIFSLGHVYGSSHDSFDEMVGAIERGHVIQKNVIMPHVEWLTPDDERDFVVSSQFFFTGRSHEHHRLCFDAAVWLLRDGRGLSMNLGYAGSGKADLFSMDGKMAVECGYTQASKVLHGTMQGLYVAVIPYEIETRTGHNVAYIFSSTEKGREEYCDRSMSRASAMVKSMTRNIK